MFRVITSGATLSSTVTIAVSEAELPFTSVTVSSTVTGVPTSLHEKPEISSVLVSMPQASVEPLSI